MEFVKEGENKLIKLLGARRLKISSVNLNVRSFKVSDFIGDAPGQFLSKKIGKRYNDKNKYSYILDKSGVNVLCTEELITPNYIEMNATDREYISNHCYDDDVWAFFIDRCCYYFRYPVSRSFLYSIQPALCFLLSICTVGIRDNCQGERKDNDYSTFTTHSAKFDWFIRGGKMDHLNVLSDVNFYTVRFNSAMCIRNFRMQRNSVVEAVHTTPFVDADMYEVAVCYPTSHARATIAVFHDQPVLFYSLLVEAVDKKPEPMFFKMKSGIFFIRFTPKVVPMKFFQYVACKVFNLEPAQCMVYAHKPTSPAHLRCMRNDKPQVNFEFSNVNRTFHVQTSEPVIWIIEAGITYIRRYLNAVIFGRKMQAIDLYDFPYSLIDVVNHCTESNIDVRSYIARLVLLWSALRTVGIIKGVEEIVRAIIAPDTDGCTRQHVKTLLNFLPTYYMLSHIKFFQEYKVLETIIGPSTYLSKFRHFLISEGIPFLTPKLCPRGIYRSNYIGLPLNFDEYINDFYTQIYDVTNNMTTLVFDTMGPNAFLISDDISLLDKKEAVEAPELIHDLSCLFRSLQIGRDKLVEFGYADVHDDLIRIMTAAKLNMHLKHLMATVPESMRSMVASVTNDEINEWFENNVNANVGIGVQQILHLSDMATSNGIIPVKLDANFINEISDEKKKTPPTVDINVSERSHREAFLSYTGSKFTDIYKGPSTLQQIVASLECQAPYGKEVYDLVLKFIRTGE